MEKTSWLKIPERQDLPEDTQNLINKAEEKFGFVPNVLANFSVNPEHLMKWFNYYNFLMQEDYQLSRREREMIAVVVSSENRCEYCLATHSSYLREITGDAILPDILMHNYRRADITKRERALLDFAVKMTNESFKMTEADLKPLREQGLNDEAIGELAQVGAMFNYTNRLLNALGWKPNQDYYGMHR